MTQKVGENKTMSQTQEIELPTIQTGTGFSSAPDYTLQFKNAESLELWAKQVKAIPFAKSHFLVEGHICLCQIEQPEPPAKEIQKKPSVSASVGKSQSFYYDPASGSMKKYF